VCAFTDRILEELEGATVATAHVDVNERNAWYPVRGRMHLMVTYHGSYLTISLRDSDSEEDNSMMYHDVKGCSCKDQFAEHFPIETFPRFVALARQYLRSKAIAAGAAKRLL